MSKPKTTAQPAPTQAVKSIENFSWSMRHQVLHLRSVVHLLNDVVMNRYDCPGGWEAFGCQVDSTFSGAVMHAGLRRESPASTRAAGT